MAAFLLMFGLVGLALYQQSRAGMAISTIGGVGAGLAAVWVVGKLFALAGRLQASGNLAADAVVGCEGTVYLAIPANGGGRVTVIVQGRQRECDAVSADGVALPTGTPVRVVRINAGVATVEKV
jgi:membrane protein implicated in regulation of membrane protease activity